MINAVHFIQLSLVSGSLNLHFVISGELRTSGRKIKYRLKCYFCLDNCAQYSSSELSCQDEFAESREIGSKSSSHLPHS